MNQRGDGGPAFPRPESSDQFGNLHFGAHGMSLRDWFAGQALAGLAGISDGYDDHKGQSVAGIAYRLADAMLAAREQAGVS